MEDIVGYRIIFTDSSDAKIIFGEFHAPLLPEVKGCILRGDANSIQKYQHAAQLDLADHIYQLSQEIYRDIPDSIQRIEVDVFLYWKGLNRLKEYSPHCYRLARGVRKEAIILHCEYWLSLPTYFLEITRMQSVDKQQSDDHTRRNIPAYYSESKSNAPQITRDTSNEPHQKPDEEIVIIQNYTDEYRIGEEVAQVFSSIQVIEEKNRPNESFTTENLEQPESPVSACSDNAVPTNQKYPVPNPAIEERSHDKASPTSESLMIDIHSQEKEASDSLGTIPSVDKAIHLIVRKRALFDAYQHAHEESQHETGGVLLGKTIPDGDIPYVVVVGIIRGQYMGHRTASLNFQPETWAEIWRTIDKDPDYSNEKEWGIVGWYHTHPSFGIFLSSHDLFIHQKFFTRPDHIALVIDPIRHKHGFFHWSHQRIVRVPDNSIIEYSEQKLSDYLKFTPESLPASQIPNEYTKDGNHVQSADS
jgi:proteasome lid subunit RPN8/RPN11